MRAVAIIGAGCSGLAAAHELRDAGYVVTVFEKRHEVGGRAASREQQGFIYDYGAQNIKTDSLLSAKLITERFRAADLIDISKPVWVFDRLGWIQEGDPLQNIGPKWSYRSGLNALAKQMAQGLDIRLQVRIAQLRQSRAGWGLIDEAGRDAGEFERVLITMPASQAVELVEVSEIPSVQRESMCSLLRKASYNPLISVMLGYRPAPRVRLYYALVNVDKAHALSWLAWEHEKAPERVPAGAGLLIAQMGPQYSRDHWNWPADELIGDVAKRVATLLEEQLDKPFFTDIYRWSYALPVERADGGQLNATALPLGLAFCGDAFVGGRIHLALEHGMEVAKEVVGKSR